MVYARTLISIMQEIMMSKQDKFFWINKDIQAQEKIIATKMNGMIIQSFNFRTFFELKPFDSIYKGMFECKDKEL